MYFHFCQNKNVSHKTSWEKQSHTVKENKTDRKGECFRRELKEKVPLLEIASNNLCLASKKSY